MHSFHPAPLQPAMETACIVLDILEGFDQRLSGEEGLSDENIHWIRKTCKKLRALLRLVRPALDEKAFRNADGMVRDFAKQLAHARDSAVLVHSIDRLSEHFGSVLAQDALAPVRTVLAGGINPDIVIPDLDTMQSALADICECFATLDYSGITRETLVDGLLDSYRRGHKALAMLEEQPDDEPAHVLRRHAKHQYNQLTFTVSLNPQALTGLVDEFHAIEDTLGLVHDLTVLIDTARASSPLQAEPLHRELVLSLAESRWLSLLSDSLRLARRLYERTPGEQRNWLRTQLGSE
jgi:CHAD domain-containing protein